jgi:hypothetical protein
MYLTAEPDAHDADDIRHRLARLELETTGRSSESTDLPDGFGPASAPGPERAKGGGSGQEVVAAGESGPPQDKMDTLDRDDDRKQRSPLRRAKGWAVAPVFAEHKWFSPHTSFGDSSTWAESVGGQIRYSFGGASALLLEAAFEHYNATDVDAETVSGLSSLVGFEFRFGLDPAYDNQLFLAPAIGYQHLVLAPTDPQLQSRSLGAVVPRARFGFRHMLDAQVALDVALDAGATRYFAYDHVDFSGDTSELLGLGVAVLWGL